MNNKRTNIVLNALFVLFLLLVVANRVVLYFLLNFDFIDSDQPLMWLATENYSNGHFYEPRFYGQNYNTMLEALLATPFYKMGVPAYECTPAVTHVLAAFPFIFSSFYLFYKNEKTKAIIVLGGLLCLTTGYNIITGIPRGFVTGIFFTSLFILSLYNPKNYFFLGLNSFLAYVAYLINPNSVLVSAPCLFYLWLLNYSDKKFYLYAIIGFVMAFPLDYSLNHFYKIHPNYVVHHDEYYLSAAPFVDALKHINSRFLHLGLFFEQESYTFFMALAVLLFIFFRKNRSVFYSLLVVIAIVLISFLFSKSQDGSVWAFYSYSRMYVAIPFTLLLFISLINIKPNKYFYAFTSLVFVFCGYTFLTLKNNLVFHSDEKKRDHLQMMSLQELKEATIQYKIAADRCGVDAIVFVENYWHQDFFVYAGSVLVDDFPKTLNPHYDRRYWRMQEEDSVIRPIFLLYCGNNAFWDSHKIPSGTLTKMDDWGTYLVSNNKLTTINFLRKTGFYVIPFKD